MCFQLAEKKNLAEAPVFARRRAEMRGALCAASLQELMIDRRTGEGYATIWYGEKVSGKSRHACGADSSHVSGVSTAANGSSASPVVGKADWGGFGR